MTNGRVELADIKEAIQKKLEFRGKTLSDVRGEYREKEARMKKLWGLRLSAQMVRPPEFEDVYRSVGRELR